MEWGVKWQRQSHNQRRDEPYCFVVRKNDTLIQLNCRKEVITMKETANITKRSTS